MSPFWGGGQRYNQGIYSALWFNHVISVLNPAFSNWRANSIVNVSVPVPVLIAGNHTPIFFSCKLLIWLFIYSGSRFHLIRFVKGFYVRFFNKSLCCGGQVFDAIHM